MQKELLVLAKSHKPGGFCIAGIEVATDTDGRKRLSRNWVRPVSMIRGMKASGAIPPLACGHFTVFDLIRLELDQHLPVMGQPENWRWDQSAIMQTGNLGNLRLLSQLEDQEADIWSDPSIERDDRITARFARTNGVDCSLMLISPQNLVFSLEWQENAEFLRKRIFASFEHGGRTYRRIPVTDPVVHRVFCNQFPSVGGTRVEKTLFHGDNYWLTLSLSAQFDATGCHHILAAAVIDQTGYLNRKYT